MLGRHRNEGNAGMTSLAQATVPRYAEKRNFQRVKIKIYGRYMREDRTEYPCFVMDMSPGNAAFRTDRSAQPGERIIAYLDHIGRVEGVVSRTFNDGFAMTLVASDRKRDKIAAQLTWLANKHELDLPEDRRHERVAPRNPRSVLAIPDGRQYACRIIDLSLSGAAVETDVRPAMGSQIILGTMRGQVVRHFDEGIAVEFAVVQRPEMLDSLFSSQ